jgi:protein-disulfide isomerase
MKRFLPFIIIGVVLLLAVLVGWMMTRSPAPAPVSNTSPGTEIIRSGSTTPTGATPPHARGDANAPVTLEEFGDFQCPPCAAIHPELKRLESEFGSRLRVIFRERPLMPMHKHALLAARVAEAAGMQGRFWEMHDLLYENQTAWSELPDARPSFMAFARTLGLDMDRFTRDIDGPAVETRIFLDGLRARALGIEGTPTLLLNNVEVPFDTLKEPNGLRNAINAALSGKNQ